MLPCTINKKKNIENVHIVKYKLEGVTIIMKSKEKKTCSNANSSENFHSNKKSVLHLLKNMNSL